MNEPENDAPPPVLMVWDGEDEDTQEYTYEFEESDDDHRSE